VNYIKKIIAIAVFAFLLTGGHFSILSANEATETREAQLRSELEQNLKEQQAINAQLSNTKLKAGSIERDIAILTAEINRANLIIREKNIVIEQLGKDIGLKNATIGDLNGRIDSGKVSLAQLLRKKNQIDDFSIVEAVLSSDSISEFFTDVDSFDSINKSMNALFEDIRSTRDLTENEKEALTEKKDKETDAKQTILVEQRSVEKKEAEKKRLLSLNQREQAAYSTELKSRERRAAEIRTALFALRDTAAIPFGTALDYAEQAQELTGIRPAFLLAILTQETNLGENIGTCNRPGDPEDKKWFNIMPGPDDGYRSYRDDQTVFLKITKNLGLDPNSVPLSCPWMNGWGGAMGPSQFIPSTWDAYVPRLERLLGVYPNPWNPEHAFMASAIYLTDLGADEQTYTAERKAALKYYAGGNWWKDQNAFYGNQVMKKATNIQENMIDPLKGL
jgi:peptidoglycan hydrolase CwlO-like protein